MPKLRRNEFTAPAKSAVESKPMAGEILNISIKTGATHDSKAGQAIGGDVERVSVLLLLDDGTQWRRNAVGAADCRALLSELGVRLA